MAGLFSYQPLSLSQQERWFASFLDKQDEILFIIETEDSVPIGTIGLVRIDHRNRKAEYGRMLIGEQEYLGQGYATDATLTLLDYGFTELNLHRIYLEVLDDNTAAVQLYDRCHFKVEGRCRDAHFTEGRFHDILVMAVLDHEYLTAVKSESRSSK
jgi:RimJ/RimL family protein N-acetyltransferase